MPRSGGANGGQFQRAGVGAGVSPASLFASHLMLCRSLKFISLLSWFCPMNRMSCACCGNPWGLLYPMCFAQDVASSRIIVTAGRRPPRAMALPRRFSLSAIDRDAVPASNRVPTRGGRWYRGFGKAIGRLRRPTAAKLPRLIPICFRRCYRCSRSRLASASKLLI